MSVVVPVYNVEPYLHACLTSLAEQTLADLEVVIVDDGSTDRSSAIAAGFAARDPRFRVLTQANTGLGAARNTGADAATGEFLAFVDSDDLVAPDAYELLLGALERSGSDFASGNVHRLTSAGTHQARFLARTFRETRLATHITRDRTLLHDRTAWNKLWRRSFWDRHAPRFPEGRLYEDIPVTLPLHFAARSVDVLADVVYYWRTREGEARSITQRRAEPGALADRLAAISDVSAYLASHGHRREKRWYDRAVVADDLKYFVNVLDEGDDDFRALFLERVNAFLDGVPRGSFRRLPAIDRVKWHLVRRRALPELLEMLRWQREDMADAPPVHERGHWYLDHPYRHELPRRLFRVDRDLELSPGLEVLEWRDGQLVLEGWAYVDGIGAAAPAAQRVTIKALRPGRLRPLRLRLGGTRAPAAARHRPELVAETDVSWAGFAAQLDPAKLRGDRWELYLTLRTGRVWRGRSRFTADPVRPLLASEHVRADGTLLVTEPAPNGVVRLAVRRDWVAIEAHECAHGQLVLSGALRGAVGDTLELRGPGGLSCRLHPGGGRFTARVSLAELAGGPWHLFAGRVPVALRESARDGAWSHPAGELALTRGPEGGATLALREPAAVVTSARWEGGVLVLSGARATGELVLRGRSSLLEHVFPFGAEARVDAAALPTAAGVRPLRADTWELLLRRPGVPDTPVRLERGLFGTLPVAARIAHKPFRLGMEPDGRALLLVQRDLDADERGRRNQRRLRATVYAGGRVEPLRDAVLYLCFGGRQYSDNPRAIHEELVRRGAPLEHLWAVRDGRCRPPASCQALRAGSREYLEALARARFVVANDHFPVWFERRPDQACLQTWHGTPLKRLGFDAPSLRVEGRRFARRWESQQDNWQYVLSPNAFSTPIMRHAFAITGEILELGYPRNDRLADNSELRRAMRRRLGLAEDVRAVLYAPTYRDHARDRDGRYRLEPALEVERLRAALGRDTVVLFRKHHYVVDPVPVTTDGMVRDVSGWPDATDLLAAADVLVTDYSSLMFDFAITGRPMLFFTYDLERYRDEIRGFYLDFETVAPGPLLRTTDELASALVDLDSVVHAHEKAYRRFAAAFCELDDGGASGRVVERVFGLRSQPSRPLSQSARA